MDSEEIKCPPSSTSKPDLEVPAKEISINHVPDEIIVEILSRLSVNTLLKFTCVSKSWRSLISKPEFIRAHFHKHSNNNDYEHQRLIYIASDASCHGGIRKHYLMHCSLHGLVTQAPGRKTSLQSSMPLQIVGSCNGLVCLHIVVDQSFYLWNPDIRKGKKIPDLVSTARWSCRRYVFGYDESIDDYKVIVISGTKPQSLHDTDQQIWADIYSLKTDSWTSIIDLKGGKHIVYDYCFASGKLHWTTSHLFNPLAKINSLDFASETYGEVEQPEYGERGSFDWRLNSLGGCLCLCCYHRSGNGHLDFWIMKEYSVKGSWTKLVSIPYVHVNQYVGELQAIRPFFVSKSGKILFRFESSVAFYDPIQKSLTHTKLFPWAMDVYVQSLVLLYNHDGMEKLPYLEKI